MTTFLKNSIIFLLSILLLIQSIPASKLQELSSFIEKSRSGYSDSHHHHHHGHGHGHGHNNHQTTSHAGGFQSFFDIALTGLAFLSFGIFLLNLLLNALIGAGVVTGTVLPTDAGTGIITDTAPVSRSARLKRDVPFELYLDPVTSMDALAETVLKSIDAMVYEHECLEKVFCDGNKEAKVIGSGFQYLMPAYSLGASYLGRQMGYHDAFSNHLSAVALGISESNCQLHFPQC